MRLFLEDDKLTAEIETFPVDVEALFEWLDRLPARAPIAAIEPTTEAEATGLAHYFASRVLANQDVPAYITRAIAWSLDWALRQPDPSRSLLRAFGLAKGRAGRPRNQERDYLIYERMAELLKSGKPVLDAALRCAEEFGIHESNVQKIYYAHKALIDSVKQAF